MTPIFVHRNSGEQAFERLYRSHVQDVYRYALMLLRNRDDAEDVAQTTFLKAYRAYQKGDRPRHPRQWLITIAHNTCGTRIRDASRRPREVALEEQLIEPVPVGDGEVDVQELVRAVGALSFNQRAALVMRELEGRTYAEIADVLDVSTSAVETLLFRARRALREQLEGTLTCGEAELVLSLELDGRLPKDERPKLRAHLRECSECASLARRQRARRAALRSLGPLPLPASLASWGGGSAAVGGGIAVKVAALLVAGVAAVGATQQAADAVTAPAKLDSSSQLVEVASVSKPVVSATRTPRAVRPVKAAVRSTGATKHRTAAMPPSTLIPTVAGAESASAATPVAAAPQATPKPVELPALPAVEVPKVEVPKVEVPKVEPPKVEVPSVPPLPVELPKVVVPVLP
jgi:RNA polymerase sigma factor (sigma-70 family)